MSEYIASWSGGKDSTASIILAHEHGEPLDRIIFVEVMFDSCISGELPEQIDWIHSNAERFRKWGYPVDFLRSDVSYIDLFFHTTTKSKFPERNGKLRGFPMSGKCCVNTYCKMKPIQQFDKVHSNVVHYVGIAADEPKRLKKLDKNKISLLQKYGFTESMAMELCINYDMLSPVYNISNRGGCWFCPNARDSELRYLRNTYPELWSKLLDLENIPNKVGFCWNTLTKTSLIDKECYFLFEDRQLVISGF